MFPFEQCIQQPVQQEHLPGRVDQVHVDHFGTCERVDRPVEKERVGGHLGFF